MGTLIYNILLFTNDNSNEVIENGAVCFDKSTITDIGSSSDLIKKYPGYNRIDGQGK